MADKQRQPRTTSNPHATTNNAVSHPNLCACHAVCRRVSSPLPHSTAETFPVFHFYRGIFIGRVLWIRDVAFCTFACRLGWHRGGALLWSLVRVRRGQTLPQTAERPPPARLRRSSCPMKSIAFALLLLSSAAFAQQAPSDLVRQYKTSMGQGCRAQAARQQYPSQRGDKICSCISNVLDQEVSAAEWQQIAEFASQGRRDDEMRVMAKHAEKTRVCHTAF